MSEITAMKQNAKLAAFTLNELLLIIATFAILFSIGGPVASSVRNKTQTRQCIEQLGRIEHAKAIFARASHAAAGAPVYQADVDYLVSELICPAGGAYTINQVGTKPTCTIPAHILAQK